MTINSTSADFKEKLKKFLITQSESLAEASNNFIIELRNNATSAIDLAQTAINLANGMNVTYAVNQTDIEKLDLPNAINDTQIPYIEAKVLNFTLSHIECKTKELDTEFEKINCAITFPGVDKLETLCINQTKTILESKLKTLSDDISSKIEGATLDFLHTRYPITDVFSEDEKNKTATAFWNCVVDKATEQGLSDFNVTACGVITETVKDGQ